MSDEKESVTHAADAAALGFYYQAFFALLTLLKIDTDNAAVGVEQLDDVAVTDGDKTLLYQLKHSISASPPPISVKSKSLWRTMKVWIDALPSINLSETTFHLVAVGGIVKGSPLVSLTSLDQDRGVLLQAMVQEAVRVNNARDAAEKAGTPLPFADRAEGCKAFLGISETERLNLLRRTLIQKNSPAIDKIEELVAAHLKLLPASQRPTVAQRLIEWWDRQVVYSLCGKRERIISRAELQHQITEIISDVAQGKLLADFETTNPPEDYQPDGMLTRQIQLVGGKRSDLTAAIREEWRARAQRARWADEKLSMADVIDRYDHILKESWSDLHSRMVEDCAELDEDGKQSSGLKLLRWTHDEAPKILHPIVDGWSAPYYVRGSYQVLAINLHVGWHPDFATLLEDEE